MAPTKKSKKPEKVWVEVEVNKFTEGITVFRGQMEKNELDAWACGELVDCSLKLENTYWHLEDKICVLGKGDKLTEQYTGVTYLRVDTVMAIFELKDSAYHKADGDNASGNVFPFPGRA